jgi:hypothetical protein
MESIPAFSRTPEAIRHGCGIPWSTRLYTFLKEINQAPYDAALPEISPLCAAADSSRGAMPEMH